MNSSQATISSITGIAGTTSPTQRIEALQSKIFSIARKFQLNDQSDEDIAHYMIERLLTRCAEDPAFIARDDGYWLRFANWMGFHLLNKTLIYNRYNLGEEPTNEDLPDPLEQVIDLNPDTNPEIALELAELRKVINSLPLHNRKLAAMLMIGYTKSEIAEVIGISRPAITQRLDTIRKRLTLVLE